MKQIFTDNDLRRLKEHLDGDCYLSTEWADARKMMPGLIARLEAAEKLANRHLLAWDGEEYEQVKAWRKACGK